MRSPQAVGRAPERRWPSITTALLISAMTLAGCGSSAPSGVPAGSASQASSTPSTSTTSTGRPLCPISYRGDCLGPLSAGTYTTAQFQPPITYTVPDGWGNWEDQPDNFLLIAPGFTFHIDDSGGSDGIGIFASVAAANTDCQATEQPGVGHTAAALAGEFGQRPGLAATTPKPVSVGGLQGLVLDIRLADGWTKTCFYSQGQPVVPLIRGATPTSDLDSPIGPGIVVRLYLLEHASATLAIQLADYSGGTHLDAYSKVVDQLKFGS
jgi:hypothetical protein